MTAIMVTKWEYVDYEIPELLSPTPAPVSFHQRMTTRAPPRPVPIPVPMPTRLPPPSPMDPSRFSVQTPNDVFSRRKSSFKSFVKKKEKLSMK